MESNKEINDDFDKPTCTVEATVVTGFELIAKEECEEKIGVGARTERGRIFFDVECKRVKEVSHLRGIDHIYLVVHRVNNFGFPQEKEELKDKLEKLAEEIYWTKGLEVWSYFTGFEKLSLKELINYHPALNESSVSISSTSEQEHGNCIPKFRVTCYRTGQNHNFTSMDAAAYFGGGINDRFHWKVDMKNHDIEIILNIENDDLYVCIALTKTSLHKRNLQHFGPTCLRATVAYNILRLCEIKPGDIVCDPMCGGGSLPIEGVLSWPEAHHICGDNHDLATPRTKQNLEAVNQEMKEIGKKRQVVDIFRWDATQLPIRDHFVDVFVTDLPFGRGLAPKQTIEFYIQKYWNKWLELLNWKWEEQFY
ncbi:THUMP domain-containing protein 3-like isoform X1 [Limulus polyphemus]|uniref:THUMP domain-containing protein 3-like isoform X1 n=1 Tax=Limulus polyphemus TaxID=6850 RepID=A0ABM1BR65_LIMPO|nr:THUMP domain-containing protein 3-like isoform X1 [Limulus polyphemus]